MRKLRTPTSIKKRIIVGISIAVPIIALGIYAFLSYQAWETARNNSNQATANIKSVVADTLATDTPPANLPEALQKVLDTYDSSVSSGACVLPTLYEWQSSLWFTKDARKDCLDSAAATTAFIEALEAYSTYVDAQLASAKVLDETIATTETDFTALATLWSTTGTSRVVVGPFETEDFNPVGIKAKSICEAIAAAYTALHEANAKEDKAAFDAAEKMLNDSYAQVPEITQTAYEVQKNLTVKVVNAYKAL